MAELGSVAFLKVSHMEEKMVKINDHGEEDDNLVREEVELAPTGDKSVILLQQEVNRFL